MSGEEQRGKNSEKQQAHRNLPQRSPWDLGEHLALLFEDLCSPLRHKCVESLESAHVLRPGACWSVSSCCCCSVLSLQGCSSLGFCVVMLDGVWVLIVGGAASSWEELLGASLA